MIAREEITALLLCGGEASRLGGVQKALLDLHGHPLVSWMLKALEGNVGAMVLSANADLPRYAALGYPIVTDTRPGLGPLGGLHAALNTVTTPWLFVCAGDMPHLNGRVVHRLSDGVGSAAAAYAFDGQREQFLCVLLRTDCSAALDEYLEAGLRSARGFLHAVNAIPVSMPDLHDCFANVNDPESLAAVRIGPSPTATETTA